MAQGWYSQTGSQTVHTALLPTPALPCKPGWAKRQEWPPWVPHFSNRIEKNQRTRWHEFWMRLLGEPPQDPCSWSGMSHVALSSSRGFNNLLPFLGLKNVILIRQRQIKTTSHSSLEEGGCFWKNQKSQGSGTQAPSSLSLSLGVGPNPILN